MDILFRKAQHKDIESIIDVQNHSFYDDFIKYGECPAYNETSEAIKRQIDSSIVYVIEHKGEIIGDIIIKKKSDDRYYLRVICIVPEYHGHGIGQRAVEFIEKDNPSAKSWELVTPFESFRNHHFYEKMGYVKVSEFKHSDVLTMFEYEKELNQ